MNPGQDNPTHTGMELSIILPARNEEAVLPVCLASLLGQSEPGFELGQQWELILVNDDSTDKTRQIASEAVSSHPGVTLIDAPPLDLNASDALNGKNNACWAGAQLARGKWLLFTDADTIHEPHNLSRSLREAERHHAALLSYSARQIVFGFWQHALMPLVYSELASVYPPQQVSDPHRPIAAANGQFLLIDRNVYFSIGGHRVLGTNVLEDVAIATSVKREHLIRFRYAPEALSTRMYRTTGGMIEGWTKNLALLMPRPIYLAAWRVLDLLLFFGLPVLAFTIPWLVFWQKAAIMILWVRTVWRFYARVTRSNFPAADIAISIFGVPLFIYLLVRSSIDHNLRHSVTWKGRSYNTGQ